MQNVRAAKVFAPGVGIILSCATDVKPVPPWVTAISVPDQYLLDSSQTLHLQMGLPLSLNGICCWNRKLGHTFSILWNGATPLIPKFLIFAILLLLRIFSIYGCTERTIVYALYLYIYRIRIKRCYRHSYSTQCCWIMYGLTTYVGIICLTWDIHNRDLQYMFRAMDHSCHLSYKHLCLFGSPTSIVGGT